MTKRKLKLTKALFTMAIITSMPAYAIADEQIDVKYVYSGDLITMINPTYWDYDYNTVIIKTSNTNIRLTKEEFDDLLSTNNDEIMIEDEGSYIIYNKETLIKASEIADECYNYKWNCNIYNYNQYIFMYI